MLYCYPRFWKPLLLLILFDWRVHWSYWVLCYLWCVISVFVWCGLKLNWILLNDFQINSNWCFVCRYIVCFKWSCKLSWKCILKKLRRKEKAFNQIKCEYNENFLLCVKFIKKERVFIKDAFEREWERLRMHFCLFVKFNL